MTTRRIIVGGGLEEAAKRVAEAWHRAERGETFEPEDNVTFASWSALASVMSDKRHELLKHLHRNPAQPNGSAFLLRRTKLWRAAPPEDVTRAAANAS